MNITIIDGIPVLPTGRVASAQPSSTAAHSPRTSSFLFGGIIIFIAILFAVLGWVMSPRRRQRRRQLQEAAARRTGRNGLTGTHDGWDNSLKAIPLLCDVAVIDCRSSTWRTLQPLSVRHLPPGDDPPPRGSSESQCTTAVADVRRLLARVGSPTPMRGRRESNAETETDAIQSTKSVEVAVLVSMPSQYERPGVLCGEYALGMSDVRVSNKTRDS